MDKWTYIKKISKLGDRYGNLLIELMNRNNKINLQQITFEEAREFYMEVAIVENKLLVLCSGGFDSILMLTELLETHEEEPNNIIVLFFNYGQRNLEQEKRCTQKICDKYGLDRIELKIPSFSWSDSSLFKNNPRDSKPEDFLKSQYVPMRNMIFFSYALSLAQSHNCNKIYSAILGGGTYADTNKEFMQKIMDIANSVGIDFIFPLSDYTKHDLGFTARYLNISQDSFFSCNNPVDGEPCGKCPDCISIKQLYGDYMSDDNLISHILYNKFVPDKKFEQLFKEYPISELRMLINNKCNTQCTHCFYGFKDTKEPLIPKNKWFEIINEAHEINHGMNFHFSGKEPFVDTDIFEYADYIDNLNKTTGSHMTYDVVTNGINVEKYINYIKNRNFTRVCVSVDYTGCTRKFGESEKVIKLIVKNKIPVHAFIVAHPDNLDYICDMIIDLHNLGVERVLIKNVMEIGSGSSMTKLTAKEYSWLYQSINDLMDNNPYLADIKVDFCVKGDHFWELYKPDLDTDSASLLANDINYWSLTGDDYFGSLNNIRLQCEYACLRFLWQVTVTPDGFVLGCATEVANMDYYKTAIGNLIDSSLEDLIKLGKEESLRRIVNSKCKSCIQCFHKKLITY